MEDKSRASPGVKEELNHLSGRAAGLSREELGNCPQCELRLGRESAAPPTWGPTRAQQLFPPGPGEGGYRTTKAVR